MNPTSVTTTSIIRCKYDQKKESVDIKKDVDALLEGEDFSDEFKTKAETIFEAAVSSRISEVKETLEEEKTLYDDRIDGLFSGDDFRITEVYDNSDEGTIIFSYDFCPKLSDYYLAMMEAASKVSEDAYPPTCNLGYDIEDKEFIYPAYW